MMRPAFATAAQPLPINKKVENWQEKDARDVRYQQSAGDGECLIHEDGAGYSTHEN